MEVELPPDQVATLEAWPAEVDGHDEDHEVMPDPTVKAYRPHPGQVKFHECRARRKMTICGLGWGKTCAGIFETWLHACRYNAAVQHVFLMLAPTYPSLRDIVLPVLRAMWPREHLRGGSWESAYVASTKTLHLPNGTMGLLRSVDGNNHERVRGIERVGGVYFEEPSLLKNDEAWENVCNRQRNKSIPVRDAFGATTPRGPNWIADRFIIDPKPDHACIRGTTMDNPALAPDYVETMRRELSEKRFRQEVLGEIVTMAGSVHDISRDSWPLGNALHVPVNPRGDTFLAVDFGRLNPRAILIQPMRLEHPETGEIVNAEVIVGEWQDCTGRPPSDVLVSEMVSWAKTCGFKIVAVYGDPAGDSRNEHEYQTSADKLRRGLSVEFRKPRGAERIKAEGEALVSAWIKSTDGTRRLLWASAGVAHPLGGYYVTAENSFKAHQLLAFPEGSKASQESEKDGVNDHDTDAIRYYMVSRYSPRRDRLAGARAARVIYE